MTRLALAFAMLAIGAAVARAEPEVPPRFLVWPVYSTPPAIKMVWTEGSGTTYFTLYRKAGAGPEAAVATAASSGAGKRASHVDATVTVGISYTYRLEACDDTSVCRSTSAFTTSVNTVWPTSGLPRRVMTGFNENLAWAGIAEHGVAAGFHDGLDIGRTTVDPAPADDIRAPRGGIVDDVNVTTVAGADDGFIQIRVDVGGGRFEYDGFNHIATGTPLPVMIGDAVAPGQKLAVIGVRQWDGSFGDHTHYQLGASDSTRITVRHPLSVFTDDADRDPLGKLPGLNDENGDGRTMLYRDHASGSLLPYDLATLPLRGDIDVAAEVTDQQGTKPEQAPHRLGYWIDGPLPASEHLDDVKSAAAPYRLYDYRTEYWGLAPATACDLISLLDDAANFGSDSLKPVGCVTRPAAYASIYTEPVTGFDWPWPILHHFVVTHAGTETATRTGLSKNQFWRTAAKDDGQPVGSTHANYAGQPTTTKAWEARFPDGDYVIHLLASDMVHTDVDITAPPTRLENFAPFIREVLVSVDADKNPATGLPETPGCESQVYDYTHPARRQYPDPFTLAVTRSAAALTAIRGGTSVCVRVRFSEPMSEASVELVRERGGGSVLANVAGALMKTHQEKDTWRGTATLADDPSGVSDSSFANDEKDIAIRVTARDRRDRSNVTRTLDSNGDGLPNPTGDVNHLVKVDLSPMEKSVTVIR